jgi:decaprenylphospho-beta-D-ribofuranose 2-oxidase
MKIHGWGGYPIIDASVITPLSLSTCKDCLQNSLIPRGMGRSYGDSANAATVLQTTYLDHFIAFDQASGQITLEAGVIIRDLLKVIVPKGWFIQVTPGTSYVTVGGAIASDVHGKNHHVTGTFGQHVRSMTLLLGTGEIVTTSLTENPDLFHATCGGMGLTGVILMATIQLMPIQSASITQTTIKTSCLEEVCEAFDENSESTYSVAWIDCITTGKSLGRSVLILGEHANSGVRMIKPKESAQIPLHAPSFLLNKATVSAFNAIYYLKSSERKKETVSMMPFFYPLDSVGGWNKLYGKAGFVQYQFVLPKTDGVTNMNRILQHIAESGAGSFLAVLKYFGEANDHLLSFPMAGYTLALDFKMSNMTINLLKLLDDMVVGMGGRIYLTKDALMTESTFKNTYPNWNEFESVRHKYGAIGKFASIQSQRLGLA